jgi:F-type H+-transporting ATPase subunit delta
MKNQVLVKRYAQGLVQAVGDEAEFEAVRAELGAFRDLFGGREDLRHALLSPFVGAAKKARILEDVLAASGAGGKTTRLLLLLLEHKRLDILADLVGILPEAWNEKLGILTFEVTSVVALTEAQKIRLRRALEAGEKNPVELVFRTDPAIIGGLTLKRGHIVYDVSIEGQLNQLKQQIQQG